MRRTAATAASSSGVVRREGFISPSAPKSTCIACTGDSRPANWSMYRARECWTYTTCDARASGMTSFRARIPTRFSCACNGSGAPCGWAVVMVTRTPS